MSFIPFLKGKNAQLTFLLANDSGSSQDLVIQATNCTVKPNITEINDPILGADRDELDSETNFFEVSFECLVRDTKLLKAFLAYQRGKDLRIAMAESAVGIIVKPNDGTQDAFQIRKYVLGAWEWNIAGRTDRQKVPVPGRAKYFEEIASL